MIGTHVALFLTYRCPFSCAYCNMRASHLTEDPGTQHWTRWLRWLGRLGHPLMVDLLGGEPTLYPDVVRLWEGLENLGIPWAMTTNLAGRRAVAALGERRLATCQVVSVSVQPESPPDVLKVAEGLAAAGYRVKVNWVDHPASPAMGSTPLAVSVIPYQPWREGTARDGVARWCSAGNGHLAAAPDGTLYRCQVDLMAGGEPVGHIDRPYGPNESAYVCLDGCTACYTTAVGSWNVGQQRMTADDAAEWLQRREAARCG